MRRHPVRLAALLALGALAALACGPKRAPGLEEPSEAGAAGALTGVEGGVGAVATGGAAGATEGGEGPGGGAEPGGAAGAGTGGVIWPIEAVCGNGEAEPGEHCDGDDFGAWTCAAAGFEVGELACGEDCRLDVSGCTGVERCTDGRDNDGDQTVDCGDDDCENEPPCLATPAYGVPMGGTGGVVSTGGADTGGAPTGGAGMRYAVPLGGSGAGALYAAPIGGAGA